MATATELLASEDTLATPTRHNEPTRTPTRRALHDHVGTVPDHVPAELLAEYPDAERLVSATRAPRGGVKVVDRGHERPIWALRLLAVVACAALAALTA